jgi:hypothetical protein
MWKQLYEMVRQLLTLTRETQENKGEIKELRQELRRLSEVVQRLAYEIHRVSEVNEHQHEKTKLWVENQLLKLDKRLPPPREDSDKEMD